VQQGPTSAKVLQRKCGYICAIIFIQCLSALLITGTGCSRSHMTGDGMMAIDYAHEVRGVFCHGTISKIGGAVNCTWTCDKNGQQSSEDIAVSGETFDSLWDAFSAGQELNKYRVKNADQQMDFRGNHVIGLVYEIDGNPEARVYLIPATAKSNEFLRWRQLAHVPVQ
jgi:hypothetical protein